MPSSVCAQTFGVDLGRFRTLLDNLAWTLSIHSIKDAVNGQCSIIDKVGLNIFTQKKFNYIGFVLDHVTSSTNRMDAIPARMNGVASSSPQQLKGTH